jgi:hypothetical protein
MPKLQYHRLVESTQSVDVAVSLTALTYTRAKHGDPARVVFTYTPEDPFSGFPPMTFEVRDDPDGKKPTAATDIIVLIDRPALNSALLAAIG